MEKLIQINSPAAVLGTLLYRIAERYRGRLHLVRPMGGRRWIACLQQGHEEIILWYEELLPSGYTSRIETIKTIKQEDNMKTKSKAYFVTLNVTPESKKEFIALRNGMKYKEQLHDFFNTVLKAYKKTFCPECGWELKEKSCNCKATERL